MNNFKFTGANIAAAVLILFYFFPWISITIISLSGLNITSNGISPGVLAYGGISGMSRFLMVLAVLVPLCGAVILYQNITGNKKFDKFYKPAHIVPCLYLILGVVVMYFKLKPEREVASDNAVGEMMEQARSYAADRMPGVFDILSFGFYVSLIAGIYLLLVGLGKVKDKEYYKSTPPPPPPPPPTSTGTDVKPNV